MVAASPLSINTAASDLAMAEAIFGTGVQIVSANYTGASSASGIYSGGLGTSPGVVPSDTGVILSTGNASEFTNSSGDANQNSNTSGIQGTSGDSQLTAISGFQTFDAAVFEATFIPDGNVLTMQIVFSSEEYLEYVGTRFNDATAVFVNGEQAELTVGTGDITINNVNTTSNENLYVDNPEDTDPFNTEMDGFTVTLTLKAPVKQGEENTIKFAIADAGDRIFDSNLLIAGDSVQVALIAEDDAFDVFRFGSETVDLLANDTSTTGSTLTITQINGVDVVAGDSVTLPTGEVITLNADGTITAEPSDAFEANSFTYTVSDADGNTDVAFATVNTVPCFAAGTLILTPSGPRIIDDLQPGDRVITRDHGAQPVRWIGRRRVPATGTFAPVVIEPETFGPHDRLVVSPQHRILCRGPQAELTMGTSEVLVAAKHLVNGQSVWVDRHRATIDYVHILFDRHEVVWANGVEAESYHPGPETLDTAMRRELLALFPELAPEAAIGPSARSGACAHEALALFGSET